MPSLRGDEGDVRMSRQKEQELRRSRGEISCAECRRLKLRCDKKVPCASCTRRGCQSICPNGTLAGGQGTRFVLADTDKLHRKLNEMSERIRQLEDALQITYTGPQPHPLLTEELLSIKRGIDAPDKSEPSRSQDLLDKETLEAFGTLSLCEGTSTKFMGLPSLRESTESLPHQAEFDLRARLPKEVELHATAWPFEAVNLTEAQLREHIERNLPSWERATALCEAYLENLSWYYRAIERSQLMEELMPTVYKRKKKSVNKSSVEDPSTTGASNPIALVIDPCCAQMIGYPQQFQKRDGDSTDETHLHDLALILMVFASGAAGDLTQEQYNEEAETYQYMARAALGLKSIFDGATLITVQATSLLGAYHVFSARRANLESAWLFFNISYVLAASIGLHRDPGRWGLDPKVVQRRRSLFWELFTTNNWQSVSSGRPTVFCLHNTDCEYPEDVEAGLTPEGQIRAGYWRWKQRFTKEVLAPITERMGMPSQLKYSSILEMDRQIRDFHLQFFQKPSMDPMLGDWNYTEVMQHVTSSTFMEIASLVIHRNFFAKAILDHPSNPLRSPFAPSFLSAYRSATSILKTVREQYEKRPQLMIRLWPIWSHALGAAVIVASVVTRGPSSTLAPSAFIELGLAVSLFEKAQAHPAVKQGLPILIRLRDKAQHAFYEQRTVGQGVSLLPKVPVPQPQPQNAPSPESEPSQASSTYTNTQTSSSAAVQSHSPSTSSTSPQTQSATPSSTNSARSSPKATSRRASPREIGDDEFNTNIPQAVLNTRSFGSMMTQDEDMHPELRLWTQQYAELAKSANPTASALALASGAGYHMPPQSATSLLQAQQARMWSGLMPSSSGLAASSPSGTSTPSMFTSVHGQSSAPTAIGLQNNLSDLLNLPYNTNFPNAGSSNTIGFNTNSSAAGTGILFGDAFSAQLPMEVGTDDTWKMFVQDQGFQDPAIFEML